MRHLQIGSGEGRKFIILEVQGSKLRISKGVADGSTTRSEKDLGSESAALATLDRMANELMARGYTERGSSKTGTTKTAPTAKSLRAKTPSSRPELDFLSEAGEESSEKVETLLPRLAPAAEAEPKKKAPVKKKKKKRKSSEGGDDGLDKRVIAGIMAVGLAFVGVVGYLGYAAFFKPASIEGNWQGSRTEHEIGKFLTNTEYKLVLDDQKRASMSVQGGPASSGTYAVQGDRLVLTLKDEDGETTEIRYKIALGGSTLDLFEPEGGKKVVQLIRFHEKASVARSNANAAPRPAPQDIAGAAADPAEEARLVSVPFAVKDGAFSLRHPTGWEVETGSRPDNSYSWVRLTRGSAKVQVFADVVGSLMAGSANANHEEGSELAPVHGAHLQYKRNASEMYGDYKESEPATFKGSVIGEGRIAAFTGTGEGLFGSKLRGVRVTLLTNDRRVSILCEAPAGEFEKLKPTFLAVCRSLSR